MLITKSAEGRLMRKQKCIICRKELNSGIIINGRVICKACEKRLLSVGLNTDFYDFYRDCIKKAMVQTILNERTEVQKNYK
ncbi:sigma factor G inhibitor Gin [Clostridium oryzae]|uniref:Inhibitor of sigma-G Gin n=1 Tax=Clostridium oryzae TaxID=1450648 RepID=A0A1V4IMQ4_9CLOT|nr:inhibitor of sigma-G Gin [Clostridium oryzae]